MNLQTKISLKPKRFHQIDYKSKVVLLGSCFSENIGEKFDYYKFQSLQNPFGILFHPLAIERFITNAINKKEYIAKDVFLNNERWHCFDAHSKLSDTSETKLLSKLNSEIDKTHNFLKEASHIIITLGTAWTYRYIEDDKTVTNCHKIPQKRFLKELLSIDEISESLDAIISLVKSINPSVNFIFTVSPVRHIKDGFIENMQSKAHLISAIHQVLEKHSSTTNYQLDYFPSYEIMMDELRDYRFYKEDMLHPNQLSVNYIWEKFKSVYVSEETNHIMVDVENIQKGLSHKPFNPNSEAHQKFILDLETKIKTLNSAYSHIQFI